MSALSTVAYEDVTHLLGGVDLLSPPCRHRRGGSPGWFWCKAILAGAVLTVDGGGWGCPRCLYERREKFQYGVRPAGDGDASCAVFLLEDFADALSGDPRVEVYE